jgi:hypothetical protein
MDWTYNRQQRHWMRTVNGWSIVVMRTADHDTWHAVIEREGERHESPEFNWPHEGRVWCDAEIARLEEQRRAKLGLDRA